MRVLPTLLISLITASLGFLAVMHQRYGNLDFIMGAPPLKPGENVYQFDPASVGGIHILNSDGTRGEIKNRLAWVMLLPDYDQGGTTTL